MMIGRKKKLLKSFVETIKINVTKIKMSKKNCRKIVNEKILRDYLGFLYSMKKEKIYYFFKFKYILIFSKRQFKN